MIDPTGSFAQVLLTGDLEAVADHPHPDPGVDGAVLHPGAPAIGVWVLVRDLLGRRQVPEALGDVGAAHIVVEQPRRGMEVPLPGSRPRLLRLVVELLSSQVHEVASFDRWSALSITVRTAALLDLP